MPLASGLLCRKEDLLAGGDAFLGRSREFAGADAILFRRVYHLVGSIDGREASARDAKRDRSTLDITSPDRERATGPYLFQQTSADQLSDDLSGGLALNIRRQFNAAILAPRSRGQNHELGISEFLPSGSSVRWCSVMR